MFEFEEIEEDFHSRRNAELGVENEALMPLNP